MHRKSCKSSPLAQMLVFNQLSLSTNPLLRNPENRVSEWIGFIHTKQQTKSQQPCFLIRFYLCFPSWIMNSYCGALSSHPDLTWSHGMSKVNVLLPFHPGLALRARKAQKVKSQLVTCENKWHMWHISIREASFKKLEKTRENSASPSPPGGESPAWHRPSA